jgi:membrane protein
MTAKIVLLLGETYRKFQQDYVMRAAASISFFVLLTIVPLLLVTLVIGGAILEGEDVQARLIEIAEQLAGPQAAEFIERVLTSLGTAEATTNTTIISVLIALWAASLAFAHLRSMLDTMWEVDPEEVEGVKGYVVRRVVGIAFLFLLGVLVVLSVFVFRLLVRVLDAVTRSEALEGALSVLFSDLTAFALLFVIFFAIYRILPHKRLPYPDLIVGAAVTTGLFLVGEWALSIYFERSSHTTLYGAAGTAMILLIWLYYSSTIVLTSAEFTYVWSQRESIWADAGDLTLKEAVMRYVPARPGSQSRS